MWSSASMRSRSASVAWAGPWASKARMPKWIAVAEYQTSAWVESTAGTPSVGENWENPVRTALSSHTLSSRLPSTEDSTSWRGTRTSRFPARPLYVAGGSPGDDWRLSSKARSIGAYSLRFAAPVGFEVPVFRDGQSEDQRTEQAESARQEKRQRGFSAPKHSSHERRGRNAQASH